MKKVAVFVFLSLILVSVSVNANAPVFVNPGLPNAFTMKIRDRLDPSIGWVQADVEVKKISENGIPLYVITSREGNYFRNEIKINVSDLMTVSENRYDVKKNILIESYAYNDGKVDFYNREKDIKKVFSPSDKNIYTRYAYFISFMGFPFEKRKEVKFKSYMYEYGDALNMLLRNVGKKKVTVPAGSFECYVLELSVGGWQSAFASDKYFIYFTVDSPHYFVKYEQKEADGKWYANELVEIKKRK